MSRYAALLVVPLIAGVLIAVAGLLINELRERRERRHTVLREARRLDGPDYATFSAESDADGKAKTEVSPPSPRAFSAPHRRHRP